VEVSQSSAELRQYGPDYLLFDPLLLLRLRKDEVGEGRAIEELHHYVDVVTLLEAGVVFNDVGVVQLLEDRHLSTNLFNHEIINGSLGRILTVCPLNLT
jgi:hypothetical protein